MVPAPGHRHQQLVGRIYRVLAGQVDEKGLGEVNIAPFDVILSDDTVVQPDLLVVMTENLGIIAPEGVRGAPDLVVEVLSPGTAKRDRGIKRHLYGRHGVREYWIIDPDGLTVEVAVNQGGHMETCGVFGAGDRVESQVLFGLDLMVDVLLAGPAR
jgi:Uma2 family endonuclease